MGAGIPCERRFAGSRPFRITKGAYVICPRPLWIPAFAGMTLICRDDVNFRW